MSVKKNLTAHTISAIIFDVDGVLVNTVPLHFRAWKSAFAKENIVFGKREYQLINGIPRNDGVRIILGATTSADRIREIGDRKQNYYQEMLWRAPPRALPGIVPLLRKIRQKKWHTAAASSSKNAIAVIAAAGLTNYFDAIITGYDFLNPKPDPDIFLTAAKVLAAVPSNTLVVEDAAHGIRAARTGGFPCIGISTSESAGSLRAAGASKVVSSTKKLASYIFV